MAAGLEPAPYLVPALKLRIVEPKMRIDVVGEDAVFGRLEATGTMFDDVAKKIRRDSVVSDENQVIDGRPHVSAVLRHVGHQVGELQAAVFDEADEIVGVQIAAVE